MNKKIKWFFLIFALATSFCFAIHYEYNPATGKMEPVSDLEDDNKPGGNNNNNNNDSPSVDWTNIYKCRDEINRLEKMLKDLQNLSSNITSILQTDKTKAIKNSVLQKIYDKVTRKSKKVDSKNKEQIEPPSKEGDPVYIVSGQYTLTDTDASFIWGLNEFNIDRNYLSFAYPEGSFGKSWTCSLDTRLVFGIPSEEVKKQLKEIKESMNSCQKIADDNWWYASDLKSKMNELDKEYKKIKTEFIVSGVSNSKTLYGQAEEYLSCLNYDEIIHISENGGVGKFRYDSTTKCFKPVDSNDGNSCSIIFDNSTNVFIVKYIDGHSITYSKNGLPLTEKDRYGLTVEYKYDSNNNICGVTHRNTEILTVSRNNSGKIQSIKNNKTGDLITYEYENNQLKKVTDAQNDIYLFEYDNENDLTVLVKPDNSWSTISYGYIQENNSSRKVVLSHTDEEGNSETYDYSVKGKVIYRDADGLKTAYTIENNRIINQKTDGHPEITWQYNDIGQVAKKTDYTGTAEYLYDGNGNLTKCTINGLSNEWKYENNYGFITEYFDEENNNSHYEYDQYGNCICKRINGTIVETASYNEWGGIKITGKYLGKNEYNYNSDYQIISDKDYTYEYTAEGELSTKTDKAQNKFIYTYENGNKISVKDPYALETTYLKNNRKDVEEIIIQDLIENVFVIAKYSYDKRHLVKEIYTGKGNTVTQAENELILVQSFDYTPAGRLSKTINWNYGKARENDAPGICTEYVYDFNKCSLKEISYFVDENCKKRGNESEKTTAISFEDCLMLMNVKTKDSSVLYKYENDERLRIIEYPDGSSEEFFYDNSGRVTGIKNIYGGLKTVSYKTTGNISSVQYEDGSVENFRYDNNGKINEISINNETISYTYNDSGIFKQNIITKPLGREKQIYDCLGNLTEYSVEERSGKSLLTYKITYENNYRKAKVSDAGVDYEEKYDSFGRCISSGKNNKEYEYDLNGNIIAITEKVGKKVRTIKIEYNAENQISYVKMPSGNEINYFHDAQGNLIKQTDSAGTVWEGTYYANGKLKSEKGRLLPEKEYFYDDSQNLTGIDEEGDVIYRMNYNPENNVFTLTDAKGNTYLEQYDECGRIKYVKDRLGNTKAVSYGINKKTITDFNGNTTVIDEDVLRGKRTVEYKDKSQEVISWDILNQISSIYSPSSKETYAYQNGRLTQQVIDGREYLYAYDAKGRKRTVRGNDFSEYFTYNDDGSVKQSVCNDLSVSYVYDDEGREISTYSTDGSITNKDYDIAGRLTSIQQKNKNGSVNFAEYYIYDDNGRISCITDQEGKVTLYEYDKHGRLTKAVMPYEKELEDRFIEEYSESGDSIKKNVIYKTIDLSRDNLSKLKKIWSRLNLRSPKAQNAQLVWTESYEYDENGNRIRKETPAGTIYYYYDKENRLVKYGDSQFVNIEYDKNGNMVAKNSVYKNEKLTYSLNNRVTQVVILNKKENVSETYNYTYDALSRRITKSKNGRQTMRTVYDGFSLNPITEYRISGKSQNVVPEGFKSSTETYFPEQSSFLYVNDILRGQTSSSDTYVFCNDLRGSIRSIKSVKKTKSDIINYDVNGNPVINSNGLPSTSQTEISSYGLDRMYCGKSYDPSLNQYDFGYRSYSPSHNGFTSSDPAFDGYNWYSYCANDPVNFYDPDGRIIYEIYGVYIMNDYKELLGNEPKDGVRIKDEGCYITTMANLYTTAVYKFGSTFSKEDYSTPEKINDDKTLFQEGSGNLNFTAMDKIFGKGNWDYWTKKVQGSSEKLLEKLKTYEDTKDGYMVVGIFDLSSASSNVPNHMVGINGLPNEDGVFEGIVPTSIGDKQRLADKDKKKAYSIENLKEFRVVKIDEYNGCKEGE